ncbi:HIT domain protein [Candidatus Desulfosporosinus infrequens]|uniref:HIT domain protein n=1 Tax=Candidatus Desulfosporosinus infrequens TaxID=2043169 RepID=A0A2U3L7B9_9FIRM|nr:HIT domain protein [Candidatus Desulfosporosinus infrequens]
MSECVFCSLPATVILAENELAKAFFDKFPVSVGHVLIITKRHVKNIFEATPEEMASIGGLLRRVKEHLDEQYHPDGYNIGVNVGDAAGQTVFHLHVHVIPRYRGDAGTVQWHS